MNRRKGNDPGVAGRHVSGSVTNKSTASVQAFDRGCNAPPLRKECLSLGSIICRSANMPAKAVLPKEVWKKGAAGDEYDFANVCERTGVYDKTLTAYKAYIIEEAKQLFERELLWTYANSLAHLLIEKEKVNYLECRKLYKEIAGNLHFDRGSRTVNKRPSYWPKAGTNAQPAQ